MFTLQKSGKGFLAIVAHRVFNEFRTFFLMELLILILNIL